MAPNTIDCPSGLQAGGLAWVNPPTTGRSVPAVRRSRVEILKASLEVATGKRILSPSDDPAGASRALNLTHASAANAQYQRNIDSADSRLGNEDQTLSSVSDLLDRVRTLALEGQNGTLDSGDRKNIATEIRQRLSQLVALANTKDANGEYIFAGNATVVLGRD